MLLGRTHDLSRTEYTRSGAEGSRRPGDVGIEPTGAKRRPHVRITSRRLEPPHPTKDVGVLSFFNYLHYF